MAPVYRRHAASQAASCKTSETIEAEACQFYSGTVLGRARRRHASGVGHRPGLVLAGLGPVLGDPADRDRPAGAANPNLAQDVLDDRRRTRRTATGRLDRLLLLDVRGHGLERAGLITVKLSVAPNDTNGKLVLRAIALYASDLVWMVGNRVATDTGAFTWTPIATTPRQQVRVPRAGTETDALKAGEPLKFLPAPDIVSDLSVHDPARGTLGSCYVTTIGNPLVSGTGHDGPGHAVVVRRHRHLGPTGLRNVHPNGTWPTATDRVTAPALGVVVDPDDKGTVYVATSVGVVRGTLVIGGTNVAPTYAWTWSRS